MFKLQTKSSASSPSSSASSATHCVQFIRTLLLIRFNLTSSRWTCCVQSMMMIRFLTCGARARLRKGEKKRRRNVWNFVRSELLCIGWTGDHCMHAYCVQLSYRFVYVCGLWLTVHIYIWNSDMQSVWAGKCPIIIDHNIVVVDDVSSNYASEHRFVSRMNKYIDTT